MPDLAIGALIDGGDWPAYLWQQETTQILDITSTTPIAGSNAPDGTFVAPTTGRVIIIIGGGFRSNTSARIFATPYVWLGTGTGGTVVIDDTDFATHGVGGVNNITTYAHFSRRSLLSGLTAGATYFAQYRYWVDGGANADLRNRDLAVIPAT